MSSPVFNDTSGTRVSTIQWGSRIFLVVVVLLGAAVALTLRSHVEVPGLERFGPVLDSQELRPAVPTARSDRPTERATVKTGSSSFRPQLTTSRVSGPTADAAKPARRGVAPATAAPAVEPSDAPTLRPPGGVPTGTAGPAASARPTRSATPPLGTVGPGAVKTRNPKAATPSPRNSEAPGQNRVPKPKSTTGIG